MQFFIQKKYRWKNIFNCCGLFYLSQCVIYMCTMYMILQHFPYSLPNRCLVLQKLIYPGKDYGTVCLLIFLLLIPTPFVSNRTEMLNLNLLFIISSMLYCLFILNKRNQTYIHIYMYSYLTTFLWNRFYFFTANF